MNKELTKEEAEDFYNKLWLENKELIQDNMNKLSMERFELELELIDKNKEIERLNDIIIELENERDILKSKLSETKADIHYLLENGESIYIMNKYIRGDKDEK